MAVEYFEGIGRRKQATARVRVIRGAGSFVVNAKPATEFFTRFGDIQTILAPIQTIGESSDMYDISIVVSGGGVTGQTEAVQLGLARALVKMNPDLRSALRNGGFLTRDAREKERKKPGLKRARKAPTYTKR